MTLPHGSAEHQPMTYQLIRSWLEKILGSEAGRENTRNSHCLAARLLVTFNDIAPWLAAEAGVSDAHRILRGFKSAKPQLLSFQKETLDFKVEAIRKSLLLSRREAWNVLARYLCTLAGPYFQRTYIIIHNSDATK